MLKKRNKTCDEADRKRSCRNLIYTNLSHKHTHIHVHTNTHTQPVPNHTSSDPGLRSFQTTHMLHCHSSHGVCDCVCLCVLSCSVPV